MAIKANLIVDQGTDYTTSINLTDDNDNVIDLTGYTAAGQLRKTYTSSNAVSFGLELESANGVVKLSLTETQTANIVAGRYVYDVFVTSPASVTSRIVEGIVTVTPRATRITP
jgi:hypothetical protein